MRAESIRLETAVRKTSGIPVIDVSGEVDMYTAPHLKAELTKVIDSGAKDLIVNLAEVTHIDSSGFGTVLGAARRVRPKGGIINLVGCSDAIERILRITRLDTVFGVFPEVEDAVLSVKKQQGAQ